MEVAAADLIASVSAPQAWVGVSLCLGSTSVLLKRAQSAFWKLYLGGQST